LACCNGKKKVKERIVLREIHLRTTGRHLSMGSHSVICYPTGLCITLAFTINTHLLSHSGPHTCVTARPMQPLVSVDVACDMKLTENLPN